MEEQNKKHRIFVTDESALKWQVRNTIKLDKLKSLQKIMREYYLYPQIWENLMIRQAASQNAINILQFLLDDGRADVNAAEGDPIKRAIHAGNLDAVKLLLADDRIDLSDEHCCRGYDPIMYHSRLFSILTIALEAENFDIFKMVLTHPKIDISQVAKPNIILKSDDREQYREEEKYLLGYGVWTLEECREVLNEVGVVPSQFELNRANWQYYPERKRKIYVRFLCCLKRLKLHQLMRDLHDIVIYFFITRK